MSNNEKIKLTLPINAAYVSAARLTASSVSNRLKFDIEEIEDIKVAVSEACSYIIKKYYDEENDDFKIEFDLSDEAIKITLEVENSKIDLADMEDMSMQVISAVTDELNFNYENNTFKMTMLKKHIQTSFE